MQKLHSLQSSLPAFPPELPSDLVQRRLQSLGRVVILKTSWYASVLEGLTRTALEYMEKVKIPIKVVEVQSVPGSFELPLRCVQLCEEAVKPDLIVALGCVVEGETPHFEYVCQSTSQALMDVQLKYRLPIGFGLLTTRNLAQAEARMSKGQEAAHAALWMYLLQNNSKEQR